MIILWVLLCLPLFVICEKPNIIFISNLIQYLSCFIVMDDMGWSDVSFKTSEPILTPAIESIREEGIDLEQYYSQDVCSPIISSICFLVFSTSAEGKSTLFKTGIIS